MGINRSNPDQYQVRFPPGLRDRIKRYAEKHGRSMNEEIVRILEREFPPPVSIDERISDLLGLLNLLRQGRTDEFFGRFSEELFDVLVKIKTGEIKASKDTKSQVESALERWEEMSSANAYLAHIEGMDEEEVEALLHTGHPAKIVAPEPSD